MTRKVKATQKKPAAPVLFAVIQGHLKNGPRSWFESETEAYEEAHSLLQGKKIYAGYQPPRELIVVKFVGTVEAAIITRRSKKTP